MPPEVFIRKRFSKYSDVWSFGITCWEFFSYAKPPYWEIEDNQAVKTFVDKGGRLEQPENCPSNIWSLITECWNKQPHTRPAFDKLLENLMKSDEKSVQSSPTLNVLYQ